jgi:hypothetical protein
MQLLGGISGDFFWVLLGGPESVLSRLESAVRRTYIGQSTGMMMKPEPGHRPRATRFTAGLPATIRLFGRDVPCRAVNLSRSGVLLVGELPPLTSPEISLTLLSPGGDLRLTLAGRITRTRHDREREETSAAVKFLGVPEEDRDTLEGLISRVIEGGTPAWLEALPANASPEAIRSALEAVPLAHRIALAGRGQPSEREILIRDTHMQVIDALARNPSLLPHEVMKILRKRNLLPHTLQVIGQDQRWSSNADVRTLVVTHRSTPPGVAETIISRMDRAALERVIRASDLQPALRAKVLGLLKR